MRLIGLGMILMFGFVSCKDEQGKGSYDSLDQHLTGEVKDCFYSYKAAILDQKGEEAVRYLSRATVDEYQSYVDLALNAPKERLKSLSFINRMQVLIMRHQIPLKTLEGLNGRGAIVYAVDKDWIGKNGVITTEIAEVSVSGSRATASVMIAGELSPTQFQFRRENGDWKFDLISILTGTNVAMKQMIKESRMDEETFIFTMLESMSGRKVEESIWTPPVKGQ